MRPSSGVSHVLDVALQGRARYRCGHVGRTILFCNARLAGFTDS